MKIELKLEMGMEMDPDSVVALRPYIICLHCIELLARRPLPSPAF